jgi:hypothetical protein
MHGSNNKVKIQSIQPDTETTSTTSDLSVSGTVINVTSTTPFTTFEGIGSTSRGYALIENEVVRYTSIGTGTLQIDIQRSRWNFHYTTPIRISDKTI